MDPRAAVSEYISRILDRVDGVKAMLLDDETSKIFAVIRSHSDLLLRDVLLIDNIKNKRKSHLPQMAAIAFLRPSAENVRHLRYELQNPTFGSYHLFFSNFVRASYLEEIAHSDEQELVAQVHEYFADFYALDSHLYSLNVCPCLNARIGASSGTPASQSFERSVDGILALLLAIKRRPVVHYEGSSTLCKNIAERVAVRIDQESSLFNFRAKESSPVLLLLDRFEDPVTPLLNQWTYEAMIHELLGISNNQVSLAQAPKVPNDLREVVLDAVTDNFYKQNRYENFGELGISLKKLVDSVSSQMPVHAELQSIDAMMRFVGSYPEFRQTMASVSKHVALSSELSRLVEKSSLLEVSQVEQDLACREAESEHRRNVLDLLRKPNVSPSDKLRLVLLYSLRYEEAPNVRRALEEMVSVLRKAGVSPAGLSLISDLMRYAGSQRRAGDIFSNRSFFALASNTVRRGIGGVDNVYTQHEPLLAYVIDDLLRGRAKTARFPSVQSLGMDDPVTTLIDDRTSSEKLRAHSAADANQAKATASLIKPMRELIIFIAGGATYEESKCVSGINGGPGSFKPPDGSTTASAATAAKQLQARIILGGSCMTNSTAFAVEISRNATFLAESESSRAERIF